MPESILQAVLEPILQGILEVGCHFVGRIVVPIVTLGRIQCDRFTASTPRKKLRWGGLFHRRGQYIYLTPEATAVAGCIFVALVVGGGVLIYYFA